MRSFLNKAALSVRHLKKKRKGKMILRKERVITFLYLTHHKNVLFTSRSAYRYALLCSHSNMRTLQQVYIYVYLGRNACACFYASR